MKLKFATSVILIISALIFPAQAQDEFNLLDPGYLWRSPNPETKIEFSDSTLTISSISSSTGIYNLLPLDLPAEKYDVMVIEMKTTEKKEGEVSWSEKGFRFKIEKSYSFYLKKPGRFHTYYLNLGPYLKSKKINHFLFFPFSGPGSAELKTFKLIKSSLKERFLAGWQEFCGPWGRAFTGHNHYLIKSSRFLGKPILSYLNWIILISLLIFILLRRPKAAVFFILALWVLLEASSLVNNWISFRHDLPFWNKTLEQKREMQNVRGFYKFIKFAEDIIPESADFTLKINPHYPYNRERAGYYLYPRRLTEEAEYLLVFDEKADQEIWKAYKILKKFRKNAYIFKQKI